MTSSPPVSHSPAPRRGRRRTPSITRAFTAACATMARFTERSEEHTSELQSQSNLVCRLLLEKKKKKTENSETDREEAEQDQCFTHGETSQHKRDMHEEKTAALCLLRVIGEYAASRNARQDR